MPILLFPRSDSDVEDVGHRLVTAELLDYDGTPVAGDPLANAFDVNWYDELNGPGRGGMSLPLSEPGATEVVPGRFVNCRVQLPGGGPSQVRFTFRIEGNPQITLMGEDEEFGAILTVGGRGWTCIFDDCPSYPEVELDSRIDTPWRLFSFASPSFPNSSTWDPAVELYEYLDGVSAGKRYQQAPDGELYPSPIAFPWPLSLNNYDPDDPPGSGYEPTYWIWTQSGNPSEEYELGWGFFRNEFTIASDTTVTFAVTGDNFFTLFLEGVPILGENEDHWIWQGWKEVSIMLSAGTYTVAAVVENVGFPGQTGPMSTNPAGFIMNAYEMDSNQMPIDLLLATDDSWISEFVSNVDPWPGWTPGQIVQQLIDEAEARGEITMFANGTFTASTDSSGEEWRPLDTDVDYPTAASFAIEVGGTLLDALTKLYEEGWIEWRGQPGTFTLDVFRGRQPTPSSAATLAVGTNITSVEFNSTDIYANALLVQWDQGYVEVVDTAAEIIAGTRISALYSSDASSKADAEQAGRTELIRRAQEGWQSIIIRVEPTGTTDCPYESYKPGQWVTVPLVGGGTQVVRVLSIACQQDDMGFAVWTLELNRKMLVPERQNASLLRQIGGRNQIVRGTVT